jgi:hypothetical protein
MRGVTARSAFRVLDASDQDPTTTAEALTDFIRSTAPELDRILDAASLEDYAVDLSRTTVMEAAREVAGLVGWMR